MKEAGPETDKEDLELLRTEEIGTSAVDQEIVVVDDEVTVSVQ